MPYDTPVPEVDQPSQPPADAAIELKRLLSVNVTGQDSPMPAKEGDQANALLAMLRGNAPSAGLAPPAVNDLPPVTPLEQVTTTPPEPNTPHYHHAKPSPAVKQQPPPSFPFPSPAHQRVASLQPSGMLGANAHDNLQRVIPHMSHMSQQSPQAASHIHPQGPYPSMQQQLFPRGHPAPIAHGPVAPSASQLPAPRLNNHAMNLLNAFRAPSYPQGPSPGQFHATPQHQSSMNFPGPNQPLVEGYMQAQQPPFTEQSQYMPQRSVHQNSLLGLFKSPEPTKASPAQHGPSASFSASQSQSPAPPVSNPTSATPQQRNATLAMLTRTLPKAKATPPPQPDNQSRDMFPAKLAVREAQTAQDKPASAANTPIAADAPRAPVSILPRPGSAANENSSASPTAGNIPTPHKFRRGHKNDSPASFTILQRPSPGADQNGSPELPEVRHPAPRQPAPKQQAPRQPQEAPKQFQPQILQRPRVEKPGSGQGQEQSVQNNGEQRNALLALFAKQNPGLALAESRSGSAMSGSSGAPLPTDPTMFRSRLASASSAVSNGGDNDGLKSPATPVEAKGFLLDYLNGVVKNEKNKGPKRGHV